MTCIATAPVSPRRAYQYDTLGCPTSRTLSRQGASRNDAFTYNDRSESPRRLVGGLDKTADGVRRVSLWCSYSPAKQGEGTMGCARSKPRSVFAPQGRAGNGVPASQFISDVVHGTGLNGWDYDRAAAASSSGVANRPVLFSKVGADLTVACTYDYMGRRATKKVTENGTVTLHQRYLYRGYLQIAVCDLLRSNEPCLWLITWDPTQEIATRPLAIQKNGTWYTFYKIS